MDEKKLAEQVFSMIQHQIKKNPENEKLKTISIAQIEEEVVKLSPKTPFKKLFDNVLNLVK